MKTSTKLKIIRWVEKLLNYQRKFNPVEESKYDIHYIRYNHVYNFDQLQQMFKGFDMKADFEYRASMEISKELLKNGFVDVDFIDDFERGHVRADSVLYVVRKKLK